MLHALVPFKLTPVVALIVVVPVQACTTVIVVHTGKATLELRGIVTVFALELVILTAADLSQIANV